MQRGPGAQAIAGAPPGLRQNRSGYGHHSGRWIVPAVVGIWTSMHQPSLELQGGLRSNGGRFGRTSIQEYWFGPRCPGSSCPYHAASQSESSSESSGTTSGAALGAGSGCRALGRVVSLGSETGPGWSDEPGCPGSGAVPDDAAPLPVPGYGMGQVFGVATGGALELSGGGVGAASDVSSLTSAFALAGDGAIALGGGSLTTG